MPLFLKKRAKLCLCKNKVWNRFRIWIIKEKKWKKCLKSRRRKTAEESSYLSPPWQHTHCYTASLEKRERRKKGDFSPSFYTTAGTHFHDPIAQKSVKTLWQWKKGTTQELAWLCMILLAFKDELHPVAWGHSWETHFVWMSVQCSTTTTAHTHIIQSKGDDDFFSAALNLGSFSESLDIIVVIFLTPQGPSLEAMASKKDHILETHFVWMSVQYYY